MSHVYPLAKQSFLSAGLNLTSLNLKVALLDSSYTYSSSHQYMSSISGEIQRGTTNLASKTVTNGVFDAADYTLTAVVTGHTITQFVIFYDTGTDATSNLIAHFDGFNSVTNGGDVTVTWDSGSARIFAL